MPSRVNETTYLRDVIGVLREWGCVETELQSSKSRNTELRRIVLANEASVDVNVTLWGPLAHKYSDDEMRSYAATTVVIVLTCCKVQIFKRVPCLVSTASSQLYVNPQIPNRDVFKAMLPVPVLFRSYVQATEDSAVNSVVDLNRYLQGDVSEITGTTYNVGATIVDVDLFNDWKYVQCSICRKKVQFVSAAYYCSNCENNVSSPRHGYRLVVRFLDTYDDISCVMFDEVSWVLLGISADDLVAKNIAEIRITGYNVAPNNSREFSVSKYICDMQLGCQKTASPSVASNSLPLDYSYEDIEKMSWGSN
ncbi:replication protein A 70 kDa DNA-binding subunit B-like [Bidens hawaiensis]|uniref:replication protein A 70 kDa DNA-binding subunit B-like n=1 Tax=Bidens hawaiensis TaxID=980011 RepID=UPI00404AEA11